MGQADEISVQGFTINRQVTLKGALIGKNTFRVGQSPFLVLFFFFYVWDCDLSTLSG